ncbi:MAG: asparaginase [Lachnospiraceae bacterium]|nr:asparaginase [Lachnospiraceae bacterium]
MNIRIIFTGGTIGSAEKDNIISTDSKAAYTLLEKYRKEYDAADVSFETSEPLRMLSENLSASEINLIIKSVREAVTEDTDGIIVTHGTDTIQYTAAALSLILDSINIPVMLVSSAYPLDDERQNGTDNFAAAVEFIKEKAGCGVFVPYRNKEDGYVMIHDAQKLMSHHETTDSLFSLDDEYYACYMKDHNEIILNSGFHKAEMSEHKKPADIGYSDDPGILVVAPYPGCSYEFGELTGYKYVLFRPYHSATLDTANEKFVSFCRKATEAGLKLYLSGCSRSTMYESTLTYRSLGIEILPYAPFPADYMRLWGGLI